MDMNVQQLECLAHLPLRKPTIANFGACGRPIPTQICSWTLAIIYSLKADKQISMGQDAIYYH